MRRIAAIAAAVVAVLSVGPARANTELSQLRCRIAGGFGLLLASQRATTCVYYRADGAVEFYTGSIGKVGVDLGPTDARRLVFHVSVRQPEPAGALEGSFGGAGVGATFGTGISADALFGGRDGNVALSPVANGDYTGVNVNVGVGTMSLHYEGMEGRVLRRGY